MNQNIVTVTQFNEALNARDVDGMIRLMTENCVFENTYPPPNGTRYEGQAAVRQFWQEFFVSSTQASIEVEEILAWGERCVMRWTYRWVDTAGNEGYIRGIDLYRVESGLIAEKLSYVKG